MMTITLDHAINHYSEVVDFLTYRCYEYNRLRSPDITPEQWAKIFPNYEKLEQKFQAAQKG